MDMRKQMRLAVVVATSVAMPAFAATRYMYDAIDDVRVAPLVETSWGQGEHLVQGAYNYYNCYLYPEREYSILVFGYHGGVATTGLTRLDVKTEPEAPAEK